MDQEWSRLQVLYADLGDERLMDLARDKSGLTEVAQQVVDAEMTARGLELPVEEEEAGFDVELPASSDDPSLIELATFQIPHEAATAMRLLEESEIPARIEHAVRQVNEDGPKVKMNWLAIFIERERKQDAMLVLRKGMGLFPVLAPEEMDDTGEADAEEADGLSILGNFEEAADAAVVRKALTDAGIWFQVEDEEGVEGAMVEVRQEDFERAMQVVEAAFGEA